MKSIFTAFIITLCLTTSANQDSNISDDDTFIFTNKYAPVHFNHETHKSYNDCDSCHPAFPEEFNDDISIKKIAHKTCKACHKAEGGPTTCKTCHRK